LKLEPLKVPRGKPFASPVKDAAPAKTGLPHGKPAAASVNPAFRQEQPTPTPIKPSIAGEERRRSQRVLLRVRANVHVALHGKSRTFEATTLSVNDHGALIVMRQSLPVETQVILEHSQTREQVACKVSRSPREMAEGFHIPLEFDSPARNFWRIAFPPADWRPPDDL
jgi:hypothetical protein